MGEGGNKIYDVYEVYETNGNTCLLYLNEDKANKQDIISGDVHKSQVYLSDEEVKEINLNGHIRG